MTTLSEVTPGTAGPDRRTPFDPRIILDPPEGLERVDCSEGGDWIPRKLRQLRPKASVYEVFPFLEHLCKKYGRWCTWARSPSIARELGLPEATVREAIKWLVGAGWITRERREINGEWRDVLWCQWLKPAEAKPPAPTHQPAEGKPTWDGVILEFGQGVGFDVGANRTVKTGRKPRQEGPRIAIGPVETRADRAEPCAKGADSGAKGADSGAQEPAPKRSKEKTEEKNVAEGSHATATVRFAVQEEEEPGVESPPPALSLSEAEIAEHLDKIKTSPHDWEKKHHWRILDGAGALPPELVGKYTPLPPQEAPRPRREPAKRPPSVADLLADVAAIPAPQVRPVAQALARELRDPGSVEFYVKTLDLARAGLMPENAMSLSDAFALAKAPHARKPGAVFNRAVRPKEAAMSPS